MSTLNLFIIVSAVCFGSGIIGRQTRTVDYFETSLILVFAAAIPLFAEPMLLHYLDISLPVMPFYIVFGALLPLVGSRALKVARQYDDDTIHDFGAGVNFLAFLMIVLPPMWAAA